MKPIDEIKDLEQQYWEAIQHKDTWTAMKLSDDQCIVVGAQGVGSLDRDKLGEMMNAASYKLTHYRFNDETFQFRKLTDDVVLVAYAVYEDLVVEGKPESIEAFDASVWVRRDGSWQCAMHTESLKGDPFGRVDVDRLKAV
jgi:hypothetical protein